MSRFYPVLLVTTACGLAISVQAHANTAAISAAEASNAEVTSDHGAGEIIVTATRRETNLQQTPLAISAIDGDTLASRNVTNVLEIASSVPGLSFSQGHGSAHLAVRGIGASDINPGADPRVAFYLDGVYIARPTVQLGTLFDVERIEILRGPQGTLYGRNATGGALVVVTNQPTDTVQGYVRATVGNYGSRQFDVALGGPLADTLSARFAIQKVDRNGYGTNIVTGSDIDDADTISLRSSLRWAPVSNFNIVLTADYHHEDDRNYANHMKGNARPEFPLLGEALGFPIAPRLRDLANEQDPVNHRSQWGVHAVASLDLDDISIKSITAYRRNKMNNQTDIDGTGAPLSYSIMTESAKQFSQELQFSGTVGRLDWLLGAMVFNETVDIQSIAPITSLLIGEPWPGRYLQGFFQGGRVKADAQSVYAQLRYGVTDELSVQIGGRYNRERKRVDDNFQFDLVRDWNPNNLLESIPPFPRQASVRFSDFTPSITVDYQFTPDIFGYVTVSNGFKSGNFSVGVDQPPFKPEKVWNYEVGLKTSFFDRRLRLNLAGFYYDYTNLQVSIIRGQQITTENAANAKIYGLEADMELRPFDGFVLDAAFSYLNSEYRNYYTDDPVRPELGVRNLSGNQLTQAPKYAVNVGAQHTVDTSVGSFTLRGEYNWTANQYFLPFNTRDAWQPSYDTVNLFLTYRDPSGRISATAFVRNLENDDNIIGQAFISSELWGYPIQTVVKPPRTYGLKLGYEF